MLRGAGGGHSRGVADGGVMAEAGGKDAGGARGAKGTAAGGPRTRLQAANEAAAAAGAAPETPSQPPKQAPKQQGQEKGVEEGAQQAARQAQQTAQQAQQTGGQAQHLPKRPQMLVKALSVDLLQTYNAINQKYYARKAGKKSKQPSAGHSDASHDYVIKAAERLNDRYVVDLVIGKGSFGRVVKAYDEVNDEFVAIKIIKSKRAFRKQAQVEIKILTSLHKGDPDDKANIVRMKESFMHHAHQCIVFELLSINLYELLRDTRFYGVSLNLVRKFARQLLTTVEFTSRHEGGVIHCDLKPENILLRNSKHSAIKVIDFGSACFDSEKMFSYIQSRFYRAPEVLLGCPYSVAIDMWSIGCVLVEMHTGRPVFDGANAHEQVFLQAMLLGLPPLHMILAGTKSKDYFASVPEKHAYRLRRGGLDLNKFASRQTSLRQLIGVDTKGPRGRRRHEKSGHTLTDYTHFLDLIKRMLEYDPARRIKPAEALEHPFFKVHAEIAVATDESEYSSRSLAQSASLDSGQSSDAPRSAPGVPGPGAGRRRTHSVSTSTLPSDWLAASSSAAAGAGPAANGAAGAGGAGMAPVQGGMRKSASYTSMSLAATGRRPDGSGGGD